jgi:glycine/D-amino acid oxidase-like deaminating enzyme
MDQADLHSGVSFWQAIGPPPAEYPLLERDISCDVVVVGGGITGALISHLLIEHGLNTVLVDRERPGCGSTAASTGLLQYQVDTPLIDLIAKVGEANAVQAYRRGQTAIDELEAIWQRIGRPCEFARRPTLYLASSYRDAIELRREYECRRHFGFDVDFLSTEALREMNGIGAPAAIYARGDGQIDPYSFTQQLLKASFEEGLGVYRELNVRGLQETSAGVRLRADRKSLQCRAVVFATGYAAHDFLAGGPGVLHTTYAVASQPLSSAAAWPDGCLIWETARPYFYARQTADGRALVGGEDTPNADDHNNASLLTAKAERLRRRFEHMFPKMEFEPAYVWAGTFAEAQDGLPYIGRLPAHENVYFAIGYGGNGITFGMIAARLITDLILRRPNVDEPVFRFGR